MSPDCPWSLPGLSHPALTPGPHIGTLGPSVPTPVMPQQSQSPSPHSPSPAMGPTEPGPHPGLAWAGPHLQGGAQRLGMGPSWCPQAAPVWSWDGPWHQPLPCYPGESLLPRPCPAMCPDSHSACSSLQGIFKESLLFNFVIFVEVLCCIKC